jgi:hypothetical protein
MSEPRHRLEPAASASPNPPAAYVDSLPVRTPSGDGPDQWTESPTPESDDVESLAPEPAAEPGESDERELAAS